MLVHMKRQTTGGSIEFILKVPKENAGLIEAARDFLVKLGVKP